MRRSDEAGITLGGVVNIESRKLRWYCRRLAQSILRHQRRINGEAQQRVMVVRAKGPNTGSCTVRF